MTSQQPDRPLPRVRDYMTHAVECIDANASGLDLQRLLIAQRVTGCPVVDQGLLVGVVSRSDLVRHLGVVRARAEEASDYYRDPHAAPEVVLDEIAALSGQLMQAVRVSDLMSTRVVAVEPDDSIVIAAQRLLEHHVHRLLVLEGGQLLGVLTSQDLVRAVAAGPAA
jgi:CBS domain-containing protein